MRVPARGRAPLGPLGGYWRVAALGALLAGTFVFRGASGSAGLGPVRAAFTLAFLGIGPGLAIVGILRLDDLVAEFSLALAVSLSLDTLLATGMTLFGAWAPATGVLVMAAITVGGALIQVNQLRQLKHRYAPQPADAA